ncbi:MAG: carbohydrate porin [Propionivibrio sp.]|nr:carbohydrate porin [Propionivibrio sp.]
MKSKLRLAALATLFSASLPALAMPEAIPETWGGDLATRPRLTGDWGGLRDEMAKKGIVLDVDAYWTPQTITSGGRDAGGSNWGNAIVALTVDTGKLGLWPGGYFKVQTISSFGNNLLYDSGAMIPANEFWMLPNTKPDTGIQELTYTQFFSPQFGLQLGKINTIAPTNQFHGDYRTGFLNTALNLPLVAALVPLSAYGASVLYLPSHDITVAGMVLDPNGTILDDSLNNAFSDGVMALLSGDIKIKPFGLPGHQNLTFAWSNKERPSLIQDPSNIARSLLTARYPRLGNPGPVLVEILEKQAPALLIPTQPLNTENETWAAVYSFEQYLWQPEGESKRGLGTFFSFGLSDGKANPVKYSYSLGLVGKGIVPGRPHDEFGIGWALTEFSDNFIPYMRDTFNLGLHRESAVEVYYNFAVTPWLSISPSYQYISPALDKVQDGNGNFKNLDNTQILGIRVGLRF